VVAAEVPPAVVVASAVRLAVVAIEAVHLSPDGHSMATLDVERKARAVEAGGQVVGIRVPVLLHTVGEPHVRIHGRVGKNGPARKENGGSDGEEGRRARFIVNCHSSC